MKQSLEQILFIKVKTITQASSFNALDPMFKKHWKQKMTSSSLDGNCEKLEELYTQKGALYAEFGKIVCISYAYYTLDESDLMVSSFYHSDESKLLKAFFGLLQQFKAKKFTALSGHNIKGFDIPFVCKRARILRLDIPEVLNTQKAKPWELKHLLDTMELWNSGKRYASASLALLESCLLGTHKIVSSSDLDFHHLYHGKRDLKTIVKLSEDFVLGAAKIYPIIVGHKTKDRSKQVLFNSSF